MTTTPHSLLPPHCAICGVDWPLEGPNKHKVCQHCHAGLPCRADTTDDVAPDPPCTGSRERLATDSAEAFANDAYELGPR